MYSVWDTVEETGSSKEDLNYMLNRLIVVSLGSNFNIYVASIVFVLNFKRLASIFTEGNNTLPAAAPAAAAPAAAATAAAALAALAALPDLEPDPIYNISMPPPPLRVTEVPLLRPPLPRKKKKKKVLSITGYAAGSLAYAEIREAEDSKEISPTLKEQGSYIIIGICSIQSYAPNPRAPNPRAPNLRAPNLRAPNRSAPNRS
ncbi:hypothetical protein BT67DRAFT_432572 [Trichocladium antarcticum]|uniref:Uncharacterized protein n=1 Tax=Trichocladium antarcticum TaxID=1450529 RepID=A0AAN6UPJ3_9PEZI|nr:hypothetical protein BT67DRAFT_432572 [Trichocladium antarcticum]